MSGISTNRPTTTIKELYQQNHPVLRYISGVARVPECV